MLHNWEFPPPLPDRGDNDRDDIFRGVGKVMTAWETIEFELSRLYSVFAGDPDGDAMRDYGKPTVARMRLDGLREIADKFFVKSPSQDREGRFHALLARLQHFATRRNEVAHGIVFNVQNVAAFTRNFAKDALGKPQFLLIAPYYQIKQHDSSGLPAFGYTARTLEAMVPAMGRPYADAHNFREAMLALSQSKATPSPPSPSRRRKKHPSAAQRSARRKQRRKR
jgi:hypothetical protein